MDMAYVCRFEENKTFEVALARHFKDSDRRVNRHCPTGRRCTHRHMLTSTHTLLCQHPALSGFCNVAPQSVHIWCLAPRVSAVCTLTPRLPTRLAHRWDKIAGLLSTKTTQDVQRRFHLLEVGQGC